MNIERITVEELTEIFGIYIPLEAVPLLSDLDLTPDQCRAKLRAIDERPVGLDDLHEWFGHGPSVEVISQLLERMPVESGVRRIVRQEARRVVEMRRMVRGR